MKTQNRIAEGAPQIATRLQRTAVANTMVALAAVAVAEEEKVPKEEDGTGMEPLRECSRARRFATPAATAVTAGCTVRIQYENELQAWRMRASARWATLVYLWGVLELQRAWSLARMRVFFSFNVFF